jgi:hypothetical protein
MDVVLLNGEEYKEVHVGKIYEIALQTLSKRESETFSQGGEMLYGEVCFRKEELPSGSTWTRTKEIF